MKRGSSQLAALTRLFSSAVFHEMAKTGRSALFRRLVDDGNLTEHFDSSKSVGDAFDSAFDILKIAGKRDEYVFRAAITDKVLMGRHSLRTASMLNEFRTGVSKADVVILNGTAAVYEIKSERDSLARLSDQVENYTRVFASVNVIASEGHIDGVVNSVPEDVGVLCLSSRYQISSVRKALNRPDRICPVTVFDSLRAAEAVAILKSLGVRVPEVPNTQQRTVLRNLFRLLEPTPLHDQMVRTLKRTRNLAPLGGLVDQLPASLHAAALSIPVRRADHCRLVTAVDTPISAIVDWA